MGIRFTSASTLDTASAQHATPVVTGQTPTPPRATQAASHSSPNVSTPLPFRTLPATASPFAGEGQNSAPLHARATPIGRHVPPTQAPIREIVRLT